MKVALFIPCFVNELYPHVAMATAELLEGYGISVEYPLAQSCCGQPASNNGDSQGACEAAQRFTAIFKDYDYIVSPSGSCTSHVKHHYGWYIADNADYQRLQPKVYEIVEFLQDVLQVAKLPKPVYFPHPVSIHQSCHGLRQLGHAAPSELMIPYHSRLERILQLVDGVDVRLPERRDECCGFGGTYSVDEPEVSVAMGEDRVAQHEATGAEYIVGADPSCLMHMGGIIRHQGRPIRPLHIVEILTGRGGAA
ncbi:(Fe-S)-binding protein [Vogesella facilis]|uniref:(Fe-S)-binding protein n=1 Tax=Vogesella facilis TaxID=1655232 RepID=A0ABV7RE35_9NEIS